MERRAGQKVWVGVVAQVHGLLAIIGLTPSPIPPDHGIAVVIDGSQTVLINNLPAYCLGLVPSIMFLFINCNTARSNGRKS